ncbi:MAG: hypothetical protein ACK56I_18750, partial [bacterium]
FTRLQSLNMQMTVRQAHTITSIKHEYARFVQGLVNGFAKHGEEKGHTKKPPATSQLDPFCVIIFASFLDYPCLH